MDFDPILSFPSDLREAVESVAYLAEGDGEADKAILVTVEKGRIVCKAEKERGWITKAVESDYEGEKFSFLINPTFFGQILRLATSFTLIEGKGYFTSENFYHILSLPEPD
jgi:hypothetical protein